MVPEETVGEDGDMLGGTGEVEEGENRMEEAGGETKCEKHLLLVYPGTLSLLRYDLEMKCHFKIMPRNFIHQTSAAASQMDGDGGGMVGRRGRRSYVNEMDFVACPRAADNI